MASNISGLLGAPVGAGMVNQSEVFAQRIEAIRANMTHVQGQPASSQQSAVPAASIPVPSQPASPPFRYGSGAGFPPQPATCPGPRPRRRDRTHSPDRELRGARRPMPFEGRARPVGPQEEQDWLSALHNVQNSISTIERNLRQHADTISRHEKRISDMEPILLDHQSNMASLEKNWGVLVDTTIPTYTPLTSFEQLSAYAQSIDARLESFMKFIQTTSRNEAEASMNRDGPSMPAAPPPPAAPSAPGAVGPSNPFMSSMSPGGPPTVDATAPDPFQMPEHDAWLRRESACPCPTAVPLPEMRSTFDRPSRPYHWAAGAANRGRSAECAQQGVPCSWNSAPQSQPANSGPSAGRSAQFGYAAQHPAAHAAPTRFAGSYDPHAWPPPAGNMAPPAANMPPPGHGASIPHPGHRGTALGRHMGDAKAIHSKSESLKKWSGSAETFISWTQHVRDHLAKVHPEWKGLLIWMGATDEPLEFQYLQGVTIGPFREDATDLSQKLEQLLADYLPDRHFLRRTQLSGGPSEDGNGFTMWRRLHRDNKGEGQIVDYAGSQCLREYGRCDKLEEVSAHIDGWYELFDNYGKELEHAHVMTRGMFLDIIPKDLRTEILKERSLAGAGHRALAEWCRNRVLVLTSEKLADIRKKDLTHRAKIHSLVQPVEQPTGEADFSEAPSWARQLYALQLAAVTPPPRPHPGARKASSPRRSPSPGNRKNVIDWPAGKCFHCGGDHTRDKCEKFKKMMQEANPGKARKDWVPPVGYKSAIAKAREAAKATAKAKPKAKATKKISALLQDSIEPEDDTASENGFSSDNEGSMCALRQLDPSLCNESSSLAALAPRPISTINRFDGLQEGQSYDKDMLLSLNNWAHRVRNESSIKPKAKAKADPEIENAVKFISDKTQIASPVIVVHSSRDIDKATDIVKPLPANRKAMTKLVKKLSSNVSCQPDERLVMVDSGAFTHAIDPDVELSNFDFSLVPLKDDEKGLDGESACGGIMKCLGHISTRGTVEGVPLNVTWQSMKVKVPILSVRKLVRDRHSVRFHDGGGYIRCLRTNQRIPFFEYQGVYYLKMKFTPDKPSHESVFSRPEP